MTAVTSSTQPDWERQPCVLLPLFAHRNWIVAAYAANPAQSRSGVETIVADADQIHVVRTGYRCNKRLQAHLDKCLCGHRAWLFRRERRTRHREIQTTTG